MRVVGSLRCLLFVLALSLGPARSDSSSGISTSTAARPTCTVQHTDNADDTISIKAAIANCTSNATVLFEAGVTYNSWMPTQFEFGENVDVQLLGAINLPSNISALQAAVTSSSYKSGWFLVSGTNVSFAGPSSTSNNGGVINSFGQQWWDAVEQTSRPLLFAWKANNGSVRSLTITKPIGKSFNISGNGNILENTVIDAKSDSSAFPFNTDGFDVGGDGNIIKSSTISNGDDCVAIGSPCTNLHVSDCTCIGSHGMSIAAKGGGDVEVANILVENVRMVDGLYGARYKSSGGDAGTASNMVMRNFVVENVTFPIYVTQNYYDQSQVAPAPSNTSVTIDGLYFENFIGTINTFYPGDGSCISDPCWYNVNNTDGTQSIVFDQLYPGTVDALHVENIAMVPQNGVWPTVICNSRQVDGLDVGMKCWDGLYEPTV